MFTQKNGGPDQGGGVFFFWRPVQYIEESHIYLCFVVYRLKGVLVTWPLAGIEKDALVTPTSW